MKRQEASPYGIDCLVMRSSKPPTVKTYQRQVRFLLDWLDRQWLSPARPAVASIALGKQRGTKRRRRQFIRIEAGQNQIAANLIAALHRAQASDVGCPPSRRWATGALLKRVYVIVGIGYLHRQTRPSCRWATRRWRQGCRSESSEMQSGGSLKVLRLTGHHGGDEIECCALASPYEECSRRTLKTALNSGRDARPNPSCWKWEFTMRVVGGVAGESH